MLSMLRDEEHGVPWRRMDYGHYNGIVCGMDMEPSSKMVDE